MEFFDVIDRRRSIRAFLDKPLEDDKVKTILEAANAAPSAGDLQAVEIFLVRSEEKRRNLAHAALGQYFIAEAPLALVFCAHPALSLIKYGMRGAELYCVQDATISCAYAQLAATALDLGSVWVGAFEDDLVNNIIGASDNLRPIAILSIGYPAETPPSTPRRGIRSLVHNVT